jgi:hypothetical protein
MAKFHDPAKFGAGAPTHIEQPAETFERSNEEPSSSSSLAGTRSTRTAKGERRKANGERRRRIPASTPALFDALL